jgi:predicted phosphodiesterase
MALTEDTEGMTRRELLKAGGAIAGGTLLARIRLPIDQPTKGKVLRVAVITDLHHGLAPDAMPRMEAFIKAIHERKGIDLAIQMGDFTYGGQPSEEVLKVWHSLKMPRLNVLGNHDMDKTSKDDIMRQWKMPARYGTYDHGAFRFVVLDLNHYKKDGKLEAYANGNYFTDNATHNWADPGQLAWLESTLRRGDKPTILVSHQPLGFGTKSKPLPPEQAEVFDRIKKARESNTKGAVVACLCGHMHVDRLESVDGIPCLCVNSASYFWGGGMQPYKDPLYAFMELDPKGELRVFGRASEFVKGVPKFDIEGLSASISDRRIRFGESKG